MEEELDLTQLKNPELIEQIQDDLYDGLAEEVEEGVLQRRRGVAGPGPQIGGRTFGDHAPRPNERQEVAVSGVVHRVAGEQDRDARFRQRPKWSQKVARSSGSSPTVGSSSTSSGGRGTRAPATLALCRLPPPRRRANCQRGEWPCRTREGSLSHVLF